MTDSINPSDYPNDAGYHEADTQRENIVQGIKGESENNRTQNGQRTPNEHKKPSLQIRIWRALWKKRIFWHHKPDRPHVNWAEITTVCLTLGIVIAAFIQAYIYWKQEELMQNSLDQNGRTIILNAGQLAVAARNAKTAEDTLGEMKKGGPDTHTLAESTKSAAKTAKDTLHISERAYVTEGIAQIDTAKTAIAIPLVNSGHIPSGGIDVILYEATFNPPVVSELGISFNYIVERHKSITHLSAMAPGSPFAITVPGPKMSADLLGKGLQMIIVVGTISYNDGFPDSPQQHSAICVNTTYHTVTKQLLLVPCNAMAEFPKFDRLDWIGMTNTNNQ